MTLIGNIAEEVPVQVDNCLLFYESTLTLLERMSLRAKGPSEYQLGRPERS